MLSDEDSDDDDFHNIRDSPDRFTFQKDVDLNLGPTQRNIDKEEEAERIRKIIDSLPQADDAPVGTRRRRRLVRKRDLEEEGEEDRMVEGGEAVEVTEDDGVMGPEFMGDEEEIAADRQKVEEAARWLECETVMVRVRRRERVEEEEEEEGVEEKVEDGHKRPGKRTALEARLDEESDEEEFRWRRPREEKLNKRVRQGELEAKRREMDGQRKREKSADLMEVIQGHQIGQSEKRAKFKDVWDEKIRYKLPGMRTPLFEHQASGAFFWWTTFC